MKYPTGLCLYFQVISIVLDDALVLRVLPLGVAGSPYSTDGALGTGKFNNLKGVAVELIYQETCITSWCRCL